MPDLSELSQSSELSKPSNLIKDNQIVDNDWQIIAKDADSSDVKFSIDDASGHLLLPLALWLEHAEQLKNSKTIGVWLDSDESPEPLETLCESIPVIGINFLTIFNAISNTPNCVNDNCLCNLND